MNGLYVTVNIKDIKLEKEIIAALDDAGLQWVWNPKQMCYEVKSSEENEDERDLCISS